ncbi:BTAD domain-containing putative transcriptional regulator [Kitasatospora sp. NPDC048407]|uniref:BTAD domain-containing putative transcriptional regulator n=1 Tax=Kitasatospora sp. NPDC048407 TaxID=3364051 RepID=UPI003718BF1E
MAVPAAVGGVPFGPRLRALRRRSGLSQQAAAERAGLSTRALRDLEQGRVRRPRPRTLRQLAEALAISDEELADAQRELDDGPRLLVLGPLELRTGGDPVPVTSPMLRRLLGLLALKHPEPATRQEITDTLWPDGPPDSQQSLVHTYVSQARRLLATGVARTPTGYRLTAGPQDTDLGRFDALLARTVCTHHAPDPATVHETLALALRWWRGPVLADADPALRRHPAAVAAGERRIRAALLYADTALLLHRSADAVPQLWELVHAEPLHEGLHARLILALAGGGEQAAALDVFQRLRERLDEELGIAPGPEVEDAHLRVLRRQLPVPARGVQPAQLPARGVQPAQLPAESGPHVGRRAELRLLDALTAPGPQPRLAAVVGPPGVGKTALAVHWAHTRREHFPDGQLYIDLRGHSPHPALRPAEVLGRFLRALGTPPDRLPDCRDEAAALYRTLLADRRVLIVLDNARDAEQVRPLLPGARGCAVLVTGRHRLTGLVAADGARRLTLDALGPDEARELLGSVVGECRVAAEPEAARRLVELCDGLPLAVRAAGAGLVARDGTIAEHCARLAGGGLLELLHVEGDPRSTVGAALDLSYRELPSPARRLYRLLGLLPGPDTTADGAAALAGTGPGEAAALLRTLADAHLLRERAGRYGLPGLLRAHARELTARQEMGPARQRLFDWYLTDADEDLAPVVRQACDAGFPATARRLAEQRRPAAAATGHPDEACDAGFPATARRLAEQWRPAAAATGHPDEACDAGFPATARRLAEQRRPVAAATGHPDDLTVLGLICGKLGRLQEAAEHFTRAARLHREQGAAAEEAIARTNLAAVRRALGRPADAVRLLDATLPVHRRTGNTFSEAVALTCLSGARTDLGDPAAGRLLARAAITAARTLRHPALEAGAHLALAAAHERAHCRADAAAGYREALRLAEAADDRHPQAVALIGLATTRSGTDPQAALEHVENALRISRAAGFRILEGNALAALTCALVRLEQPQAALDSGRRALALHRATGHLPGEVRALLALGRAQSALGAPGLAVGHWREALRLSRAMGVSRLR